MNALYLQLDLSMLIYIVLNSVADIKRLFRLYIFCLTALAESNTIQDCIGFVVNKFKFYVFLLAANHLTCPIVPYIISTEDRLLIIRTKIT